MKNQPADMENHENRPMKNQPGTMKKHENRPETMKNIMLSLYWWLHKDAFKH